MKNRTITIAKKDLFFQVDAVTHVLARATEAANLHRADALESDTGDDMNEVLITMFADKRAGELKDRLQRFIDTETATTADGSPSTETGYTFALSLEDAFQDELLGGLAQAMQDYIAEGVIADWYGTLGEAGAATYAQRLPLIYSEILNYIVKRKFPKRV